MDSRVVLAIKKHVRETDCVALRLIAVWAETEQISNISKMGSRQKAGQ